MSKDNITCASLLLEPSSGMVLCHQQHVLSLELPQNNNSAHTHTHKPQAHTARNTNQASWVIPCWRALLAPAGEQQPVHSNIRCYTYTQQPTHHEGKKVQHLLGPWTTGGESGVLLILA